MKKFILTAAAAGALAFGGAAGAQDLGAVLSNILGFGTPSYNYGYNNAIPAVVAQPNTTVYVDQYGRQVYVDPYGRQVLVQPNTNVYGANNYGGTTTYGTTTYGIAGYDANGRPLYRDAYGNYTYTQPFGGGSYAYSGRSWDRDGDGIANARDRWPDDRRYW